MGKSKSDLSTEVVEKIKAMIFSGEINPGQQIVQEEFAKKLGVNRTPLLQALQVLKSEMPVYKFAESKEIDSTTILKAAAEILARSHSLSLRYSCRQSFLTANDSNP